MNNLFKYLLGTGSSNDTCPLHKQPYTKICCSIESHHHNQNNNQNENQNNPQKHHHLKRQPNHSIYKICDKDECLQKHINHQTIPYQYYKEILNYVEAEMDYKRQVKAQLHTYKQQLWKAVNSIFVKVENNLEEFLNQRKFSTKNLLNLEQHRKNKSTPTHTSQQSQQEIQDFYSHYLHMFPKIQMYCTRKFAAQDIIRSISQSQKAVLKGLDMDSFGLGTNTLYPKEEIKEIREYSKQDKLKQILPFKCQLNLKYRASENKFLSSYLYATDIRGPIILLVESHKKRSFGGYSPFMFPKYEEYIEDNRCQSFLFSMNDQCLLPLKSQYKKFAIRGGKNFCFGKGDLTISDECNKGNINWAEIGRAYKAPAIAYGNESEWLAGAWYFRVLEYEIYEVDIEGHK